MERLNLLDFINSTKEFCVLEYSHCDGDLLNVLELAQNDEQFIQKIDLGLIYLYHRVSLQYTIVDGKNRFLSLSLLLHAICECYKKTTPRNDKAIQTIRAKYLLNEKKTKLRLSYNDQEIYNKIIFGERLSGKEKEHSIFKLYHAYWTKLKLDNIQASRILKVLSKFFVIAVYVGDVLLRDVYYLSNFDKKSLDQIALIEDYLKGFGLVNDWCRIKEVFDNKEKDIKLFFKDYFVTKFNSNKYNNENLYITFMNYFETMLQYMSEDVLIKKINRSAILYSNILNVNIENELIKKWLIQIKLHKGDDTYAYILNIYEDFLEENISESTFVEILATIDDYLKNRLKKPNSVSFNELIEYLNAFITCK